MPEGLITYTGQIDNYWNTSGSDYPGSVQYPDDNAFWLSSARTWFALLFREARLLSMSSSVTVSFSVINICTNPFALRKYACYPRVLCFKTHKNQCGKLPHPIDLTGLQSRRGSTYFLSLWLSLCVCPGSTTHCFFLSYQSACSCC